jgi:hypothetical protein
MQKNHKKIGNNQKTPSKKLLLLVLVHTCVYVYELKKSQPYDREHYSCQTAGILYKISYNASNCNCFYIGKLQCYGKTRIQEHIGEVTKLY